MNITLDPEYISEVKKSIKMVRQRDYTEDLQKLADISENIIGFYKRKRYISDKQKFMLEKLLDKVVHYDFDSQVATLYKEYKRELAMEMKNIVL